MKDHARRILFVIMLITMIATVYAGVNYGFLAGLISCFVVGVLAYLWLYISFCRQTGVTKDD